MELEQVRAQALPCESGRDTDQVAGTGEAEVARTLSSTAFRNDELLVQR